MKGKRGVLAVRAFWADPKTGKELKGYNSSTVYGTDPDEPPILLRMARKIHGHLKFKGGTLPPRAWKKYAAATCGFLLALTLSGCATYSRAVDTISGVAKATAASVEILKGPAEDVGKVWETAFPPAPEPPK